jgi:hypothetical protein
MTPHALFSASHSLRLVAFVSLLYLLPCVALSDELPSAAVSFGSYPTSVAPNVNFNVEVNYSTNFAPLGYRGRVFLEIRNATNDALIQKLWDDGGGDGFDAPSGTRTFTTSVPGTYSQIYFVTYISPMEFNNAFIQEYETYPRDGTYPYKWQGNGVTHDIYYLAELILSDNVTGNYCYCSGITYQVFVDAYEDYNTSQGFTQVGAMSADDMRDFRRKWYATDAGVPDYKKCAVKAITYWNIGYEITDKELAHQGDFVQFWRHSGSGHAVIFANWIRDVSNNITGVNYWSTQTSTNGINYNIEDFGATSGIDATQFYIARLNKPVDNDDWDLRYDDASTVSNPTYVGVPTPTPTPSPTATPPSTPTPTPVPSPTPSPSPTPMPTSVSFQHWLWH